MEEPKSKYDSTLCGPNPNNNCVTCDYWEQGIRVSHNHCAYDYILSCNRRANGHYEIWNGIIRAYNCRCHSNSDKQYGIDRKWHEYQSEILEGQG